MTATQYRFLLIPTGSRRSGDAPKEERLMNYDLARPYLEGVTWDLHQGGPGSGWVINRESFLLAAAGLLPIVREACESGRYNALVLLGGGDPGFIESREIARKYRIPVTACGWAQMHVACMLGTRFSVIDVPESHNLYYADLVVKYRYSDRCASIRNIDDPNPAPGSSGKGWLGIEKEMALRGEPAPVVERAVNEAVAAIEEDGAEVITFGCSGSFWLKPFVERRLHELGWEVPVLEGYQCAISVAKLLVDLGVDASGLAFPSDRPKQWRRKKFV
jgi:Asp/Glu/hydantoin racemase